jgi:hypothetical protein
MPNYKSDKKPENEWDEFINVNPISTTLNAKTGYHGSRGSGSQNRKDENELDDILDGVLQDRNLSSIEPKESDKQPAGKHYHR